MEARLAIIVASCMCTYMKKQYIQDVLKIEVAKKGENEKKEKNLSIYNVVAVCKYYYMK